MSVTEMSYPIFELNQTLSHHDLNNLFKYLNKQDLLTRANLVGTGIISGLEATFDEKENWIRISKGCGITSEGYLIFVPEDKYYRYYNKFEGNLLSCAKLPTITGTHYELDNTLRTEGIIIDKDTLTKNVVALHYEEIDQQASCCSIKDNRGSSNIVTIRVLLVPNGNIPKNDSLLSRSIVNEKISTPIQRLNTVTPDEIVEKLKGVAKNIKDNIGAAYNVFSTILRDVSIGIDTISILGRIPQDKDNNTLNHYNFFCDLIEAYEEFRQCGEKVLLDYRPTVVNFPCHLILNGNYRHHFRPATASDDYAQLNRLWSRIVTMIEYFNPDVASAPATDNSIRLTPSVYGAVPLSEKAVPYYYKKIDVAATSENQKALDDHLHKAWTDRKNKIGYWYEWYNDSDTSASYLNYDLEQYNLVRIEGHVNISYDYEEGTAKKTRKKQIEDIARQCNLPIAVIALRKTPSDGERCISESQEKILAALQNSAKEFVLNIKDSIKIEEFLTSASNQADTALDVAEEAKQAAKSTVAEKMVNDAVGKVKTAVDLAKLANTTKTAATAIAAKKAAETATTAMNEAEKIAKGTTAEKAVNNAVTETVEAAQKIAKAAQAVQAKEAADAIGKEELNLESCLNSVDRITSTYEKVFSFACQNTNLKDHCQKISSFLQWLDTTQMIHQQCEAKNVFSSFGSFKEKHPGLQHKSGVPIGGTFILVYDEKKNTVIADFCLPYRVTQPD